MVDKHCPIFLDVVLCLHDNLRIFWFVGDGARDPMWTVNKWKDLFVGISTSNVELGLTLVPNY